MIESGFVGGGISKGHKKRMQLIIEFSRELSNMLPPACISKGGTNDDKALKKHV